MSQPGSLWHTIRNADGTWQPGFGLVESQESNNPGQFTAAGCAGVGNELQLAGVAGFTNVWHTIRNADGTWQSAFGHVGNESQQGFAAVDCGGVGSDMHLVVIN